MSQSHIHDFCVFHLHSIFPLEINLPQVMYLFTKRRKEKQLYKKLVENIVLFSLADSPLKQEDN
jgi:hypothetical protein